MEWKKGKKKNWKKRFVRCNPTPSLIQRTRKRFVNLAKQDPGRARQKSEARAGRNFSQPRTSLFRGASVCLSMFSENWHTVLYNANPRMRFYCKWLCECPAPWITCLSHFHCIWKLGSGLLLLPNKRSRCDVKLPNCHLERTEREGQLLLPNAGAGGPATRELVELFLV